MSSYYNSATTSSASSYSTSPTAYATIVKTKQPAREWADVVKVKAHGMTLSIGDPVKTLDGYGLIEEFTPQNAVVRIDRQRVMYAYDEIQHVSGSDDFDYMPDPNWAFKPRPKEI